jgi:circadian clock protein KaiC
VLAARDKAQISAQQKQATIETEEALLEVRLKAVQLELQEKRLEKQALSRTATDLTVELASGRTHMSELRGVDKK